MDKKHNSSPLVHKHSRIYSADGNLAAVRMCSLHPPDETENQAPAKPTRKFSCSKQLQKMHG